MPDPGHVAWWTAPYLLSEAAGLRVSLWQFKWKNVVVEVSCLISYVTNSFIFFFIIVGKMPTVVSPELYRTRFCEAMDKYFLMVPDHWTGLGLNCWKEAVVLKWTIKKRELEQRTNNKLHVLFLHHIHHCLPRFFSSAALQAICNWRVKTLWICTLIFVSFCFVFVLIPTNCLCLGWKVAWTFFYLS